jgi:hypothetical protein
MRELEFNLRGRPVAAAQPGFRAMNILAASTSERTSSTALAALSSRGSTAAAAVATSTETTRSSVIIDFSGGPRADEKPRLPPREQLARLLDTLAAQLDDAGAKLGEAGETAEGDADRDDTGETDATKGAADATTTLQQGSDALDRLDFVLTSLKLILADTSTGLGAKLGLIGFLSNVANGGENSDAAKQAFGDQLDGILSRAGQPPAAEADYRKLLGTFATDPAASTATPPAAPPDGQDGGSQTLFTRIDRVSETVTGLAASADEDGGSEAVYERTHEVLSGFSVRVEDGKLAVDFFRQERVTEAAAARAYQQSGQDQPGATRSAEA